MNSLYVSDPLVERAVRAMAKSRQELQLLRISFRDFRSRQQMFKRRLQTGTEKSKSAALKPQPYTDYSFMRDVWNRDLH